MTLTNLTKLTPITLQQPRASLLTSCVRSPYHILPRYQGHYFSPERILGSHSPFSFLQTPVNSTINLLLQRLLLFSCLSPHPLMPCSLTRRKYPLQNWHKICLLSQHHLPRHPSFPSLCIPPPPFFGFCLYTLSLSKIPKPHSPSVSFLSRSHCMGYHLSFHCWAS